MLNVIIAKRHKKLFMLSVVAPLNQLSIDLYCKLDCSTFTH